MAKTIAISKEKGVEHFVQHNTISILMQIALHEQKRNKLDIKKKI